MPKRSGWSRPTRTTGQQELSRALSEMEAAEAALEVAMSELQVAPRAEKVAISAVLEQALERLRSARAELRSFEESVSDPRPRPPASGGTSPSEGPGSSGAEG